MRIVGLILLVVPAACGQPDAKADQRKVANLAALQVYNGEPPRCDGRTDDTIAINAALAKGEPIVLPAGICLVSGGFASRKEVNIRAGLPGKTILRAIAGSKRDILRLEHVTGSISGIGFDQTGAKGSSMGLHIIAGKGVKLSNLQMAAPNNYGILLAGCQGCSMDGLTSSGGGTPGSWIFTFSEGRDNVVNNVRSVNAVNRTVVIQMEQNARVTNISAFNGAAQTVLFDRVNNSIGSNWLYRNTNGSGRDDAFAIIGQSSGNRIDKVVAEQPAGFGFTFAGHAKPEQGSPRFNIVRDLRVVRPGQQLLSFTDDGSATGPYCNIVTGLVGLDPNQQAGAKFPAIDYFGARNNVVYGTVRSSDRRMTFAIIEQDSTTNAGNNAFYGRVDAGGNGKLRLVARDSAAFRFVDTDAAAPRDVTSRVACFPR